MLGFSRTLNLARFFSLIASRVVSGSFCYSFPSVRKVAERKVLPWREKSTGRLPIFEGIIFFLTF